MSKSRLTQQLIVRACGVLCILLAGISLVAVSPAQALITYTASAFSESGRSLDQLLVGDRVTIDITVRSNGVFTIGLGAAAMRYDPDIVSFESGQATEQIFSPGCIPGVGCFPGLGNIVASRGISEEVHPTEGVFVQFVTAVSTNGVVSTGEEDLGVVTGLRGDPQIRLVFDATGMGSTTIEIGTDERFGNAQISPGAQPGPVSNTSVQLIVIPEPGTGILLGLGLLALVSRMSVREV